MTISFQTREATFSTQSTKGLNSHVVDGEAGTAVRIDLEHSTATRA